jgi:1,6-anhydro-N-acetylmuramate kinase
MIPAAPAKGTPHAPAIFSGLAVASTSRKVAIYELNGVSNLTDLSSSNAHNFTQKREWQKTF